jgi:6-phosphofructokinase 1
MSINGMSFDVSTLGECRFPSPISQAQFIADDERVHYHSNVHELESILKSGIAPPSFEVAGPRSSIFFDPAELTCGIVTCGGICPGLNDVIRAIVLSLFHQYGVKSVLGFRYGFEGISPKYSHDPINLTPELVEDIHKKGGTILGSSRGPQDVGEMVDTLERKGVGVLFVIGGDGTLHGGQVISEEIARRGLKIGVIGLPKTIDNDIACVEFSFGFETAVSEARNVITGAHVEATGARNGVGLVKLMGRHSGFIAAYATLASSDVNFCLVPEVPFSLDAFLKALRERVENRGHAVVVTAEGAGQDLMKASGGRDASGNIRLNDIGVFLRDQIKGYFAKAGMEMSLKYIDPSYTIRSLPANARDSAFCLLLGSNAVHAGMAGRTNMLLGVWKNEFTHVPIPLAVAKRKQLNPKQKIWCGVLATTGQPRELF